MLLDVLFIFLTEVVGIGCVHDFKVKHLVAIRLADEMAQCGYFFKGDFGCGVFIAFLCCGFLEELGGDEEVVGKEIFKFLPAVFL